MKTKVALMCAASMCHVAANAAEIKEGQNPADHLPPHIAQVT